MGTIQDQMRTIILNEFQEKMSRPLEETEWDKTFNPDLGMDSLDFVEFIMSVERAANVSMSNQSMADEDTPNKLLTYLTNVRSSVRDEK